MPINSNKAKTTIDFEYYEKKPEKGKEDISIKVKYHNTTKFGPTISLSTDGEKYVSFPSRMFPEIVNFLSEFGVPELSNKKQVLQKNNTELPLPVIDDENSTTNSNFLVKPNIEENSISLEEKTLTPNYDKVQDFHLANPVQAIISGLVVPVEVNSTQKTSQSLPLPLEEDTNLDTEQEELLKEINTEQNTEQDMQQNEPTAEELEIINKWKNTDKKNTQSPKNQIKRKS